jgi:hypothetical protein
MTTVLTGMRRRYADLAAAVEEPKPGIDRSRKLWYNGFALDV